MKLIVSDTGPILHLSEANLLELLPSKLDLQKILSILDLYPKSSGKKGYNHHG